MRPSQAAYAKTLRGAFRGHRGSARQRGVAFEFTFEDWAAWWLTDNRWERKSRDQLCMARIGDIGPYNLTNVYCTSRSQNSQDYWKAKRAAVATLNSRIAAVLHEGEDRAAFVRAAVEAELSRREGRC